MQLSPELLFKPNRLEQSAWTGHIPFAAYLIKVAQPQLLVELGSYLGNSYFAMCQAVTEQKLMTRCYAVDTWQGDLHTGFYQDAIYKSVSEYNHQYDSFSTLIRSTFDDAVSSFADASIDLLHIDGLHTYEAVKHDFNTWKPKLSKRAIVLLHDTEVREKDFGVYQLWAELQSDYPTFSFTHSHGLGVLFYGSDASKTIKNTLLESASIEIALTRDYFTYLGELLETKARNIYLEKALASALQWQKRPWYLRAFNRWKRPA